MNILDISYPNKVSSEKTVSFEYMYVYDIEEILEEVYFSEEEKIDIEKLEKITLRIINSTKYKVKDFTFSNDFVQALHFNKNIVNDFLNELSKLITSLSLWKIPNTTNYWLLIVDIEDWKIKFKFEYDYSDAISSSRILKLMKERQIYDLFKNSKNFSQETYVLYIELAMLDILKILTKNKNMVFWEVFYENKILQGISLENLNILEDIYDFVVTNKEYFISNWYEYIYDLFESIYENLFSDKFSVYEDIIPITVNQDIESVFLKIKESIKKWNKLI